MGKKGGGNQLPGLRQALKSVNALSRAMVREADGDYNVALSASQAGQANLRKQLGRQQRLLAGSLAKQQQGLRAGVQQAQASKQNVARQQANTVNRYGGALAASANESFGQARATAQAGVTNSRAAARAGKATSKIGNVVMATAQMGVKAQGQAAKYAMAQALQQRAIIDNQTIAALQQELYGTAMQYNMQMEMYERQRADALKDAKMQESAQVHDTMSYLTDVAPGMGAWLTEAVETNKYVDEEGNFNPTAAREAYAAEMGLDPELNPQDQVQLQVFGATAQSMVRDGTDPNVALTDSIETMFGGMAGWEKYGPSALGAIESGMGAAVEAHSLDNLQGLTGVDFGGDWYGLQEVQGRVEPGALEGRDAATVAIMQQYGNSTARAWLRGETGFSDDAIDWYLADLKASGVAPGNLQFDESGAPTAYVPSQSGTTGVGGYSRGGYG